MTGPDPLAELTNCRAEIEQIDRQLVELLAARMALGRRTATIKRDARPRSSGAP
jgi:chorismate mutase